MKRPKKFDVRKKLTFQNGVMVPTSKIEREAVKMGRQVMKEMSKDLKMSYGKSGTPRKTTELGKHFLIS